jgi:hypothetical protein
MKIAASITTCDQIGIETWRDKETTKIFSGTNSISDIMNWAKTIDKSISFSSLRLSEVDVKDLPQNPNCKVGLNWSDCHEEFDQCPECHNYKPVEE